MRVLLPWKAANQQNDEDGQDESEHSQPSFGADLPGEESPRKRLATRDAQDTETDTFVSPTDSKRPRLDQGPIDFEMTAGPLRSKSPSDSDDEKLPAAAQWPPLENEPHDPFYSPSGLIIRANEYGQSYANPATARDIGRSTYAAATLQTHDDEARTAPPSLFEKSLQKRGLEIIEMAGDGNCLFRAVALQVYGDVEMHLDVRAAVCDFMEQDPEHFGPFVDEPLSHYVQRKRKDGVHGNNPEIQAMSELFNRPVEVFTPDNGADQPLNIFQKEYATQDEAIRLSYHDGNHYNAVVDPLKPTAGLGLGMPGLKIGLADQLQVSKAVAESDLAADQLEMKRILKVSAEDEVHRVMKESRMHSTVVDDDDLHRALKESAFEMDYDYMYEKKALGLSDIDATNFELEQAILQSSLESYRRHEQGRKQRSSPTAVRRRRSSPVQAAAAMSPPDNILYEVQERAVGAAVAALPPAAYASSAHSPPSPTLFGAVDEYPQTVQELVMNGFELKKVVHAFELFGDDFDQLLAFLIQNNGGV